MGVYLEELDKARIWSIEQHYSINNEQDIATLVM
jgi:hypothetical protein